MDRVDEEVLDKGRLRESAKLLRFGFDRSMAGGVCLCGDRGRGNRVDDVTEND